MPVATAAWARHVGAVVLTGVIDVNKISAPSLPKQTGSMLYTSVGKKAPVKKIVIMRHSQDFAVVRAMRVGVEPLRARRYVKEKEPSGFLQTHHGPDMIEYLDGEREA